MNLMTSAVPAMPPGRPGAAPAILPGNAVGVYLQHADLRSFPSDALRTRVAPWGRSARLIQNEIGHIDIENAFQTDRFYGRPGVVDSGTFRPLAIAGAGLPGSAERNASGSRN